MQYWLISLILKSFSVEQWQKLTTRALFTVKMHRTYQRISHPGKRLYFHEIAGVETLQVHQHVLCCRRWSLQPCPVHMPAHCTFNTLSISIMHYGLLSSTFYQLCITPGCNDGMSISGSQFDMCKLCDLLSGNSFNKCYISHIFSRQEIDSFQITEYLNVIYFNSSCI